MNTNSKFHWHLTFIRGATVNFFKLPQRIVVLYTYRMFILLLPTLKSGLKREDLHFVVDGNQWTSANLVSFFSLFADKTYKNSCWKTRKNGEISSKKAFFAVFVLKWQLAENILHCMQISCQTKICMQLALLSPDFKVGSNNIFRF